MRTPYLLRMVGSTSRHERLLRYSSESIQVERLRRPKDKVSADSNKEPSALVLDALSPPPHLAHDGIIRLCPLHHVRLGVVVVMQVVGSSDHLPLGGGGIER